jgi:hypothetical protein
VDLTIIFLLIVALLTADRYRSGRSGVATADTPHTHKLTHGIPPPPPANIVPNFLQANYVPNF